MAATLLWDDDSTANQRPQENSLEDLFVFGYACKLFRDDEKAKHIDEGRHLIPWMGDERLMIDRYDGRGHLYDLTRHDADLVKGMPVEMTEEERAVEVACDEERYLELVSDVQEKAMYEEEEWKRYYESLHEGTYNAVGFSYEQPKVSTEAQPPEEAEEMEEEEEAFVPPPELLVPEGMPVPSTEKEHARIEKTASFIAKHGVQMEIMLKMKQSKNAQFDFLEFEKPLNQYYQHLVKMIKGRKYRPPQQQQVQKKTEQDPSDQHYLHPSLSTTTAITPLPPPPPPKPIVMPKFSIEDTAYGQLVSSLKKYHKPEKKEDNPSGLAPPPLPPFMAQPDYGSNSTPLHTLPTSQPQPAATNTSTTTTAPQPVVKEERVEPPPPGTEVMGPLPRPPSDDDLQGCENRSSPQPQIVPPPPDIQPIIDRMAMYVAKNGVEFEYVVKSKRDQRFSFLEPGHVHFQYYDFKKNMFLKEAELKKRLEAKQAERERLKQEEAAVAQANRSISFSIKGRNKEPESVNTLKRPLFDYDSSDGEGEGEEGGKSGGEKDSKSGSNSPDQSQAVPVPTTGAPASMATVAASEVKPVLTDDLEKKQAEERLKDKLATAARDKLAASNKEKQLQAERKKKAALFINLLRIVKDSPANPDTGDGEPEVKSSPSVTPSCSKPPSPSPEVFEYNNRSGTPTILNQDLLHKREASRSKSPAAPSRKKRRKRSRTPPSAYANPLRLSPLRYNSSQRRSHSPRRAIVGSRRLSPIRPFRSRRSPSPHIRDRSPLRQNWSPLRKKASSRRSRSRSPSPSQSKHKKKHKRSRSKTPKKKKKDKNSGASKDRESSKSGRSHDKSSDRHKEHDKKKDKEKKKEKDKKEKDRKDRDKKEKDRKEKEKKDKKDKERRKSKESDKHGSNKSDKTKVKDKDVSSKSKPASSTTALPDSQHAPLSPIPSTSKTSKEIKVMSPVPEIIHSSSSDSSSSSEDEGPEKEVVEVGESQRDAEMETDLPHPNGQEHQDKPGSTRDSPEHIDLS